VLSQQNGFVSIILCSEYLFIYSFNSEYHIIRKKKSSSESGTASALELPHLFTNSFYVRYKRNHIGHVLGKHRKVKQKYSQYKYRALYNILLM